MTYCRVALALLLLISPALHAQGFSALVSPPRFEGAAKPGAVYREVVEITNVSDSSAHFNIYTADWTLDAGGSAVFESKLAAASCRKWVGIEAKEITMAPRAKRRYRFEVAVPANAIAQECRFAIMIEGDPENVKGKLEMPVSARIGIIVYLAVGDVLPNLKLEVSGLKNVDGRRMPALKVTNSGTAHGRLEGFAELVDAKGKRWTVIPESFPILPGETRLIGLIPQVEENKPIPELAYPVKLSGKLDSGKERLPVDFSIGP